MLYSKGISFLLALVWLLPYSCSTDEDTSTYLALHKRDLLIFSTLNGTLVAIDKTTGDTVWSMKHKPPVSDDNSSSTYVYFPDPKDGSLYMSDINGEGFKRLPLSIPELVQISPSQSSDGLFYSASKHDSWLAVDAITGQKLYVFSSQAGIEATCPIDSKNHRVIHIPVIEYRVAVYDSTTEQIKWNITYTQYGAQSYSKRQPQDLLHFCSSSDGSTMSINALTGDRVWEKSFDSPVVGVYSLESGHVLRKIPITTLSSDTLQDMTGSSALAISNNIASLKATDTIMKPSLFVGFYKGKPYVMESLTDETNIQEILPIVPGSPLLEGPLDKSGHAQPPDYISLGHYRVPEHGNIKFDPLLQKDPKTEEGPVVIPTVPPQAISTKELRPTVSTDGLTESSNNTMSIILLIVGTVFFSSVVASVVAIVVTKSTSSVHFVTSTPTPSPDNSRTGSHSSRVLSPLAANEWSKGSSDGGMSTSNGGNQSDESVSTMFKNGAFKIGKILYNTKDVIGKGSQGTIVFKGTFDSRPIAVKRIINECFDLADREVSLLRESDQHPNEEDSTFRYVALELCTATLHEYVEGHKLKDFQINEKQILWESMSGVAHLHSLGIVHRDIKPQNVLLTVNSSSNVKALISDFGLCRKVPAGRGSFTAQSGVLGTEGWIAPEMFQNKSRVTFSVDIFAMGCLIYYVLSAGNHPFGPALKRQANIETGDFSLGGLMGEDRPTAEYLIKTMISFNNKFRPSAEEVLCHCLFWSKARQLAFFQDVSDRIEKETVQSHVVQALERGGMSVIKGDWRDSIGEELRQDLRKFRSYQGSSLRDLLRAMRNKKHHYRELPESLKSSLGHIPEGFVTYFTSRFPSLLVHTYKQMEICKNEAVFRPYYYCQS